MQHIINTKELRSRLSTIVECVRRGEHFTVLYRSRPAFRIVPVEAEEETFLPIQQDSLYGAESVGASTDCLNAAEHDALLYETLAK